MRELINIGLVGATGYTGQELIRLLSSHPHFHLKWATSTTTAGKKLSEVSPALKSLKAEIILTKFNAALAEEVEAVFLALPHGQAMQLLPSLLEANDQLKVVDLSADYRLPAVLFEKWYATKHASPNLIKNFVYGLAELNKEKVSQAQLVANPGCYPTAVLLATAPLLSTGLISGTVMANCLSGVSGAGRQPTDQVHFCHLNENVIPYKPGWQHRHLPEMEQKAEELSSAKVSFCFTPHLVPLNRGILATVHCQVKKEFNLKELYQLYESYYKDAFFVKLLAPGQLPEVKAVLGSNFCFLGLDYHVQKREVLVFAVLDNLVKGAAGQAVQNLNLMFGLPEETGLKATGLYP